MCSQARFKALVHICDFSWLKDDSFPEQYANDNIYSVIKSIAPTLADTIFKCEFLHQSVPCSTLFAPILTEEGLCFAFNALNSHEVYTDEYVPIYFSILMKKINAFHGQRKHNY